MSCAGTIVSTLVKSSAHVLERAPMHCPFCRDTDSKVVDSRGTEDGNAIRRRRECLSCGKRFSTVETVVLMVRKRNDVLEPFSREKVITGVRKACQGRPVSADDLAKLAQRVEMSLRAGGASEVDSQQVGLAILDPLQELDQVAYLRFASVYQDFEGLADFERAIERLREQSSATGSS